MQYLNIGTVELQFCQSQKGPQKHVWHAVTLTISAIHILRSTAGYVLTEMHPVQWITLCNI